jgi:Fe-S-cluster-containing hydrogenase component 2
MKNEETYNPTKARIRVVRLNPFVNLAITCRLCEDPQCVAACPRKALEQSEENGVIIVDEEICNGCGWCVEACEFGAIQLHPKTRVAFVCNLCDGEPQCVEWCPEEALDFITEQVLAQKARISVAKKMFQKSLIAEQ